VAADASRYDGYAEWYDEHFSPLAEEESLLAEVLGPGGGSLCLDVACGSGRYATTLAKRGYRVLGVDVSTDQLRLARRRVPLLVQADGTRLPLRSLSLVTAVGFYFHTDVEDFAAVISEIARCLTPGGRFVYLGMHPCFIGAFVDRTDEADTRTLQFSPGYGESDWAWPDFAHGAGLWVRVGGHHKTMAAFFHAFINAGLSLERVIELPGGGVILPRNVAVVAAKTRGDR
jgi:SAM-dependent methyltransferase